MVGSKDESFSAFVEAQLPRLLGYAYALSGNRHDAWDLTQEALVRMGTRWSRLDAEGNPAAYARTTLVRLNVDRLRRRSRERLGEPLPEGAQEDHYSEQLPHWIVETLSTLTPRQRAAVVLRFVDDLDVAGIAREMDCSTGTAKSHLSRGLQRLRDRAPVRSSLDTNREGA